MGKGGGDKLEFNRMQNKKVFESPFTKEEWNCKFYPPPPSGISEVMPMMEAIRTPCD